MAQRDLQALSKRELIEFVQQLEGQLAEDLRLRAALHDLEVHRDELHANQAALAESQVLLERARDAYATLFDFAPVAYVILDAAGVVTDLNFTAADLFGAERMRLVGFPMVSLIADHQRRRYLDYLRQCRNAAERESSHRTHDVELVVRRRDGLMVPVWITTRKMFQRANNEPCKFHVAIVDLTERKRLEAERLRSEQERQLAEQRQQLARSEAESKDHFIAVLSHELRTPLAPIRFAVASLRHAGVLPDALRRALDMIDRNVEHEACMIEDLLDVTRIAQKKLHLVFATVDVHQLVDDVLATHAPELERAKLEVAVHLDAVRHFVHADEGRLRQVLVNLLKNACANTPPGGHLTIHTANSAPSRLAITVQDDGRGIDAQSLARLFRPFEQQLEPGRASTGLGLGLSICKGIVEAHEGQISAASGGPGSGASFTVELPAFAAATAASEPLDSVPPSAPADSAHEDNGVRVLLVEDNMDSAESMAALLEMFGYRVRVASSVQSALRAAEQEFDVLVSDIGLPDGTGRDLIRELSTRRPVRGIALTGYGTAEDVIKNTHAGFARHLVKPIDPNKLVAAIDEVMQARLGDGTDGPGRRR